MSMGWTFTSFDWSAWSEWTHGSLTAERAARLRSAAVQDASWLSATEVQALEALAERVAKIGLETAYRDATPSELGNLDQLVGSLLGSEQLEPELHPVGHLDPWGWNAIQALAQSLTPESPARHLLTGRRPANATPPDPSSGNAYVIFTPSEASRLAAECASAIHATLKVKIADWEVEEFSGAMAELATEAGRGRGVFAHYG